MRVLGLQGSPRRNGNSQHLLSAFMTEAAKLGALTETIAVTERNILPCREYVVCEKKGTCPIEDDMNDVYRLLRWADVVVAASPIFFYSVTAQLKALIDRCQALWARKYRLKLKDPGAGMRAGVLLAVGATRGKSLFDGVNLTAKYFFDAVDARFAEHLEYRGIEGRKDMAAHPTAAREKKNKKNKYKK
jgi:multimeric flavodoxin WrbA